MDGIVFISSLRERSLEYLILIIVKEINTRKNNILNHFLLTLSLFILVLSVYIILTKISNHNLKFDLENR